ncbi:zinc ribbon domain-containing protein [Syntrophorhabdus aromaticivorans]|uniref:zinc ribbon domain-containing protein n=1 Tax=Syntrophorhabdus aromaticivorans TaxID=328301 RepID=UPI00041BC23F|nr:zinc ribbon domain-containing protein [Syntrophorhabdus aromaticivorans]
MFGIGFSQMIIGVVIAVFIATVLSQRGGARIAGPTLVLRKLKVNEQADDGFIIDIDGRASGIIAWFLTVVGFDAVSSLKVTATEIAFKSSSLFGQKHVVAPLTSITHTQCGYSKPIGLLIVGGLFIITGLCGAVTDHGGAAGLVFSLLVGIAFLVGYWLLKKMTIMIETQGGTFMGLTFKRSVIENVSVDIGKVLETIRLINKKILEAQGLQSAVAQVSMTKASGVCPKCGLRNTPDDAFCVQCGEKL